jgi:hypothetical protein
MEISREEILEFAKPDHIDHIIKQYLQSKAQEE